MPDSMKLVGIMHDWPLTGNSNTLKHKENHANATKKDEHKEETDKHNKGERHAATQTDARNLYVGILASNSLACFGFLRSRAFCLTVLYVAV